jgi:hypothetical protein
MIKNEKNNTVASATVLLGDETLMIDDVTYEPLEGSQPKSKLGKKTMVYIASKYLQAKGIKVEGTYDANKIAKGLSKIYQECSKDPDETIRRIELGGEYFNQRGLDWTPEAVWRRWEDIEKWAATGKSIKVEKTEDTSKYNSILWN